MNLSLNENQIKKALGSSKTRVIRYKDLPRIKNLDNFFKKKKYLVILYEYKKNYGHWVLVMKQGNRIEFFDSYGMLPDMHMRDFDNKIRNTFGMSYPLLADLLFKSIKPIHYNNYRLQKRSGKVNTCGRWVIYRGIHDGLTIDQFKKKIDHLTSYPDQFVTVITNRFL